MTQQEALDILKLGVNVYVTGSAGSGKTHVLQTYIESLKRRGVRVGVTASTGVAATHLNGMTIHAWAGIGIKKNFSEADALELMKRKYLHRRFQDVQVLIIDEVSMLSATTLQAVDLVLQVFKNDSRPFGGIQVILCGDFFQLPPIGEAESREYVYKSPSWDALDLKVCYLDEVFRQNDERFLSVLSEIRENHISKNTWEVLKERFLEPLQKNITPTKLYTHNTQADIVNDRELAKLSGIPRTYRMESRGNETLLSFMRKSCLAPEILTLKKDALVMFVKNNADAGYVNGTLGKVIGFTEGKSYPIIETFSGKIVTAMPTDWEIDEDEYNRAKITQIPLRLAWAITIHKSQGMSLDAAEIDLGKSFVEGLGYVALSRVRTLEGIKLRSINRTALTVNNEIIEFDRELREQSDEIAEELRGSYWYKKNNSS